MLKSKSLSLVFIAGLGHSGSTIFDLLLGAQPGVTGLGEIDVFINRDKRDWYLERFDKYPCTCDRIPTECPVWGNIKPFLDEDAYSSYGDAYSHIFETVLQNTESTIIVDSSKNLNALMSVYESLDQIGIEQDQFYVIHLVKDVRSFAVSSMFAGRRNSVIKNFRHWKKSNQNFEEYLLSNQINMLNVGYDELTLSPEILLEKIMSFISGGRIGEISLDLKKSSSHIISGNNMRLYQAERIRYDYRWFNHSKINFCYQLYPSIKKLNKKWVYSNVNHFLEKESKFKPRTAS